MRSDLVYLAGKQVPSRFALVKLAARASRLLHREGRIADSINLALTHIAENPQPQITESMEMPEPSDISAEEARAIMRNGFHVPPHMFGDAN